MTFFLLFNIPALECGICNFIILHGNPGRSILRILIGKDKASTSNYCFFRLCDAIDAIASHKVHTNGLGCYLKFYPNQLKYALCILTEFVWNLFFIAWL
jgi:hypothetical protein